MVASPAFWRCPSSSGSYSLKTGQEVAGPVADYVVVIAKMNSARTNTERQSWHHYQRSSNVANNVANPANYESPFRSAILTGPPGTPQYDGAPDPNPWARSDATRARDIVSWTPRDSFAWWSDGTSNQIVFAEKHVPSWAMQDTSQAGSRWHGGYQNTESGGGAYNTARPVSGNVANVVATSPKDRATADPSRGPDSNVNNDPLEGQCALGSSHPGVFGVLLGDGSVRSFPVTVTVSTLVSLARTQSGTSVTLP